MAVGDGALVLGRAAGGGVALNLGLLDGVGDLLTVGEAVETGPLGGVGVVLVVGDGQLAGVRRGDIGAVGLQDQVGLELIRSRTLAVLVVVVLPDLGDLDVGELVVVGVLNGIACLSVLDGALSGLTAREGRVFALGQLSALKGKARPLGQRLLKGVGRISGQVENSEVPVGLHVNADSRGAGSVVITIRIGPNKAFSANGRVHNSGARFASIGVKDGEPHPVIGIVLRIILVAGLRFRRLGVDDAQLERELGVVRSRVAGNDLGQVEVGTTVVGCLQSGHLSIDVVGLALDGIGGCARRCGVLCIGLDEHGLGAVDEHRVHGRRVELPVVLRTVELGEGEVVTLSTRKHLAILDDTDGDEGAVFPPVGVFQGRDMEFLAVHKDRHVNAVDVRAAAFPLFTDGQRLSVGCNCRRVLVVNDLLASLIASIVIGQRCVGVSVQGIAVVTIVGNVLFDFGVKAVIRDVVILELGNGVVSLLTGVAVEGYGVLDAILKDALLGEVPLHGAILEGRLRRVGPLLSQAFAAV